VGQKERRLDQASSLHLVHAAIDRHGDPRSPTRGHVRLGGPSISPNSFLTAVQQAIESTGQKAVLRVPLEEVDGTDDFGEQLSVEELDLDYYQRCGLEQLWMPEDVSWLIHGHHDGWLIIVGERLVDHPLIAAAAAL
jgi:hypothetical protein